MADQSPDPMVLALANPEFLAALDALTKTAPVDIRLEQFEARYSDQPEAPGAPSLRPAGELGELLGRVLAAAAGDRHTPLTALALYFAHRLRSLEELQTTVMGFLEGRPYSDMLEGHPSEFEQITKTAWDKAKLWRARQPSEDLEDRIEGRGRVDRPAIEPDQELGEPPRLLRLDEPPPAVEHHVWPIIQRYVSNILAGPGGSNKTALGTLLAVATACERPDLLWEPEEAADGDQPLSMERFGPVLVIDLDGQRGAFEARMSATMHLHNLTADNLKHPIYVYAPRKQGNLFHLVERAADNWFKVEQGVELVKLARWIKRLDQPFAMVMLDTFGRAHPFAMIEDTAAREAVAVADRFADYFGTSFLVISHTAADVIDTDDLAPRKRKGIATGSTAIENTARSNSGMLPMGVKDASNRGVLADRAKNLLGLTLRKANDAPEGGWYWFERHIVAIPSRQRDGSPRVVSVPALKRAYGVGEAIVPPSSAIKVDVNEAERRFNGYLVRALQGQGRISPTALAERYITQTPQSYRVAHARSTIRERLARFPEHLKVEMGAEGAWFIHTTQVTVKRTEMWTDTEDVLL